MEAVWENGRKATFPSLERDVHTDVLVIGGGMAGLLCAYMLHRAGVDYALVEAGTLCGGITKHTTAKITVQHGLCYDALIRRFGIETARGYLAANVAALQAYRALCETIDCAFEEKDAYVYALRDRAALVREAEALRRLGASATLTSPQALPMQTVGAVCMARQAQFHPLQFAAGLSRGLRIFEHTAVRELVGRTAVTDHGSIHAKQIIVATHFPFLNKHGAYFLKLYQQRSYVIALEHAAQVNGMYVDAAENGLSFRNYGGLLLLGGGGHRTGKNGGGWRALRDFAARYYPNATERYHWATQDCMPLDGMPYIGRYGARTMGLYVATGFQKWGMTSAMVAARLLCDLVQGKENPYAAVFDPSRRMLRPQLLINGFEAMVNLLTPTPKRCPHLGCALKWNKAEHSWDCPCHGSRFTRDGRCIDNPATGDLKR